MVAQWNRTHGTPCFNSEAVSFWGSPFVLVLPSDVLQSHHPTAPVKVFHCNSSCRVLVVFWLFTRSLRHTLHAMHWILPSTSPYTLLSMFLERFWKKEGCCSFFSSPRILSCITAICRSPRLEGRSWGELVGWEFYFSRSWPHPHRQTDGLKLQRSSHHFLTDPYILIFIHVPSIT
jgi:hypothetical protein